jgi:hypothetical protein
MEFNMKLNEFLRMYGITKTVRRKVLKSTKLKC